MSVVSKRFWNTYYVGPLCFVRQSDAHESCACKDFRSVHHRRGCWRQARTGSASTTRAPRTRPASRGPAPYCMKVSPEPVALHQRASNSGNPTCCGSERQTAAFLIIELARLSHARAGVSRCIDCCAAAHVSALVLIPHVVNMQGRHTVVPQPSPSIASGNRRPTSMRTMAGRASCTLVRGRPWCSSAPLICLAPSPSAEVAQCFTYIQAFTLQAGHWSTTGGCTGRGRTQQAALQRQRGALLPFPRCLCLSLPGLHDRSTAAAAKYHVTFGP